MLLHNPASGPGRPERAAQLRQVEQALLSLGHTVASVSTTAPRSAGSQAGEAVRAGAEVVFACGGDGTVHEVLQGLVSESGFPEAALGILPLGSANALARHLGLSLDPATAALQQMRGRPLTIPVGKVTFADQHRYFAVMAGAGPDGALADSLLARQKSRLGRFAYTLGAACLFLTRRFPPFIVEFSVAGGVTHREAAVSAMAVRVCDLGGLFTRLTGGHAHLEQAHVDLLIVRPPGLISLPLWFLTGWLGLLRFNPFLRRVAVTSFTCTPLTVPAPLFEADGEGLGRIPIHITLVPHALRILLPENRNTA